MEVGISKCQRQPVLSTLFFMCRNSSVYSFSALWFTSCRNMGVTPSSYNMNAQVD